MEKENDEAGPQRPRAGELYGEGALLREDLAPVQALSPTERRVLAQMLDRGIHAPWTTSAGRLFDALAAALNICRQRTYEGQPALELEMAATAGGEACYQVDVHTHRHSLVLDAVGLFRQAVEDYLEGTSPGQVAARFHASLAQAAVQLCRAAREQTGLNLVALSGGVWQNALLVSRTLDLLRADGFTVLQHRLVPPNDGGIALGQVAVAAALAARES